MKRTVRLTELDISRIVRGVIKEQKNIPTEMCSSKDQKPSAERPLCLESGVSNGKIISFGEELFLHYNDKSNCPRLCRVQQKTTVTIS